MPVAAVSLSSPAISPMTDINEWLKVDALDLEAQGVARNSEGKVVFIEGALPGETVRVKTGRRKNNWEQGELIEIGRESAQRVTPGCPNFGLHAGACGGCKMQHFHAAAQVAVKQRTLEDNLWHLGKVRPERVMRPIEGPTWGYRYRARLSVRHVVKKGTVLVGFHERKSRYIADMSECRILPPHISAMLLPLRALVMSMDARDTLPQIELALGESPEGLVNALVLRHLEPLGEADLQRLRDFAALHRVQWWLQPKGPDTVHLLDAGEGAGPQLAYTLPEFGVTMPFKPTDFTQVNHHINRVLVARALKLLDAQPDERVIDWFCGLGNFTLPIATQVREVLGIEGSEALVQRSRENAVVNRRDNATFAARNLFELSAQDLAAYGSAARTRLRAADRTAAPPRAWSTCSRTPRMSSRSRCSSASTAGRCRRRSRPSRRRVRPPKALRPRQASRHEHRSCLIWAPLHGKIHDPPSAVHRA